MKKSVFALLIAVYVLIEQGKNRSPVLSSFEGMSQPVVEKMLKMRKVKYKIITKEKYEALKSIERKKTIQ